MRLGEALVCAAGRHEVVADRLLPERALESAARFARSHTEQRAGPVQFGQEFSSAGKQRNRIVAREKVEAVALGEFAPALGRRAGRDVA